MKHLNDYLQAPKFAPERPNFELRMEEHNGLNPIHQARVAKDFQMLKPKTAKIEQPKQAAGGSPWLSMQGGK